MLMAEPEWKTPNYKLMNQAIFDPDLKSVSKPKPSIWGNIKNIGSKIIKSPLGKLGGRIFGGAPAMLAFEMDWDNPDNYFLPRYEYDAETDKSYKVSYESKSIWE